MTITVPPCDSLNPERHNMQKILEVTKKMMELLTGEVSGAGNSGTFSSKEEWEYLEGHKDLYKDVMMDNQPPLTSPVHGWEMRKTSEDCLTLSPDWKVEDEDITQYSPGENPAPSNVHPAPPSVDGPSDSSYPEEPQTVRDRASLPTGKRFSCTECRKCFRFESRLNVHKRSHMGESRIPVLSAGNVFQTSTVFTHIRNLTQGRRHIPALSVGNVFHKRPIFTHIRDVTQERSRIPALSVGNVFQRSPIFTDIRDLTWGRSRIPVLSVGNVFHRSPIFTNIRDLTRGRSNFP
ncbi:unnamed protein product, partial [Staurois parvus]